MRARVALPLRRTASPAPRHAPPLLPPPPLLLVAEDEVLAEDEFREHDGRPAPPLLLLVPVRMAIAARGAPAADEVRDPLDAMCPPEACWTCKLETESSSRLSR